jgi:hypothetical protein
MALTPTKISAFNSVDPAPGDVVAGLSGSNNRRFPVEKLGAPAMGLWDWWCEGRMLTTGTTALDGFVGAAVGTGGTNTQALPTGGMAGFNAHGVFLRSGTAVNSGYRYSTTSLIGDYFGTIAHKFVAQAMWRTAFTDRLVRLGYIDSITSADSADGAYFEITGDQCIGKTANNSVRTPTSAFTMALDTPYTFDIEVNAAGTAARFRIYAGTSLTPVFDQTVTANIPTTSARTFGAGIVAVHTTATTAQDILILYSMGLGTVAGFNRARGIL